MKITGNRGEISKYVNDSKVSSTKDSAKEGSTADSTSVRGQDDTVNLSQMSKDVNRAKEAMAASPDIRADKVQPLKEQIANGTYEVDFEKTAEKMIKAFLE